MSIEQCVGCMQPRLFARFTAIFRILVSVSVLFIPKHKRWHGLCGIGLLLLPFRCCKMLCHDEISIKLRKDERKEEKTTRRQQLGSAMLITDRFTQLGISLPFYQLVSVVVRTIGDFVSVHKWILSVKNFEIIINRYYRAEPNFLLKCNWFFPIIIIIIIVAIIIIFFFLFLIMCYLLLFSLANMKKKHRYVRLVRRVERWKGGIMIGYNTQYAFQIKFINFTPISNFCK